MSKKRRVFSIEMPDEPVTAAAENFPAGKVAPPAARRGPMATAISETADSSRDRAETEARIRAENDALAHEHVRLKKLGLITDLIPLEQIDTWKLTRDRSKGADMELAELVISIRELGLSNPIQLEQRADGRYELIQGFRRLSAYKELLKESGDAERWGKIPAGITAQGATLEALYRRMVDENLVRKDISFAEMAQLALYYAMDPETKVNDPDKAVAVLYQSTGYSKRSYIRAFIKLMAVLGEDLRFAPDIPRALGLALVARLEEVPGTAAAIRTELKDWENRSVKDELDLLRRFAGQGTEVRVNGAGQGGAPRPTPAVTGPKARTSFQLNRAQGRAKCVAANGKLEVRLNRDFSTIDRRKLEAAVRSLLDQLE
jgi:ParB family transcriptional regulator, chromosome partitioning protein